VRIESPPVPADQGFALEPGRNCWRVERANHAAFIVDAADYYRHARKAMLAARRHIFIMGWDVDTRIRLTTNADDGAPEHLGPLLTWLVHNRPELSIYILAWDGGAYKFLGRGSTLFRLATWARHERMHFRFDGAHPREACHHQKILVVDDCLAFCGGIDMTGSRWDTRGHLDDHPGRRRPTTGRSYPPWHDTTMAVDGDAAKTLGDLARLRWKICTDDELPCCPTEDPPWPEDLQPLFENLEIGIARTRGRVEGWPEVREIEALFVDMIEAAERFVYVENQYFSSRVIAQAVIKRLQEENGPEFCIVSPKTSQGWLDDEVMSPARAELMKAVEAADKHGRFRIYTPVTKGGEDIYVHSKVMIVDDKMFRVGSANFNNRSMGLDSECDLLIDGRGDPRRSIAISRIRADLMAEHLGCTPEDVEAVFERKGSLIAAVEALRGEGRTLVPFEPEEPNKVEKWIAHSEVLDPETADQPAFEPIARHRLLWGLGRFAPGRRHASR
jgi:phospholipase D1/2